MSKKRSVRRRKRHGKALGAGFFLPADSMNHVLAFLDPVEGRRMLLLPLNRSFLVAYSRNECMWRARCRADPWYIPDSFRVPGSSWRALDLRLTSSLSMVKEHANPSALLEVLDLYNSNLVTLVRPCFQRLGQLLESDDAPLELDELENQCIMTHALRALETFRDDAGLQVDVLHFLVVAGRPRGASEGTVIPSRRSTSSSGLDAFGPGGDGVQTLMTVMAAQPQHAGVLAMACWSLVNLALAPAQKAHLLRLGGIEAVLAALAAHSGNFELQYRGLFALINMVTPTENVRRETLKGVVFGVLAAMRTFSHEASIVNRGCLVLHNLSLDSKLCETMVKVGAREELASALNKHSSDTVLCQCASGALRRLRMAALAGDVFQAPAEA